MNIENRKAINTSIRLYDDERQFIENLAKKINTNVSGAIRELINLERAKGEIIIHVLTSLYNNNAYVSKHGFKKMLDEVIRPVNDNGDVQTFEPNRKTFHVSDIKSALHLQKFIDNEVGKLVVQFLMKDKSNVYDFKKHEYVSSLPLSDELIKMLIESLNRNGELFGAELILNKNAVHSGN